MRTVSWAAVALIATGCAHRGNGLTAVEHRSEASEHQAEAVADTGRYDPHAVAVSSVGRAKDADGMPMTGLQTYNPTASWLAEADRQLKAAADHLKAADKIEKFEEQECRDIPAARRAGCPLLASEVATVEETATGVKLHLTPATDAPSTTRMLKCHLAYARAKGFDQPSCPLFVKGVAIELEGAVIDFHSNDPLTAAKVREEARRIFRGKTEPAPSTL